MDYSTRIQCWILDCIREKSGFSFSGIDKNELIKACLNIVRDYLEPTKHGKADSKEYLKKQIEVFMEITKLVDEIKEKAEKQLAYNKKIYKIVVAKKEKPEDEEVDEDEE
jgi:hypothetical protein